jgi:ATP-dependent Clp protease ATP-binding subunit ClpA
VTRDGGQVVRFFEFQRKKRWATNSWITNGCSDMFERFTEYAIKVIMLAQQEAIRMHYNHVGAEQMFLGLLGVGKAGECASNLSKCADVRTEARAQIKRLIGQGDAVSFAEIPFNDDAKQILEGSWNQSKKFGHAFIGEEHIFLSLLEYRNSNVLQTLDNLHINIGELEIALIGTLPPPEQLRVVGEVTKKEQVADLMKCIRAWQGRSQMALDQGSEELAKIALEQKALLEKRLAEVENEPET